MDDSTYHIIVICAILVSGFAAAINQSLKRWFWFNLNCACIAITIIGVMFRGWTTGA